MVAQLEHQFRLGRLSVQGLWFFCQVNVILVELFTTAGCYVIANFLYLMSNIQPMMAALHALSIVIEKASSGNLFGSGTLNLLQSQVYASSSCFMGCS